MTKYNATIPVVSASDLGNAKSWLVTLNSTLDMFRFFYENFSQNFMQRTSSVNLTLC